jgi:hypothetical protein
MVNYTIQTAMVNYLNDKKYFKYSRIFRMNTSLDEAVVDVAKEGWFKFHYLNNVIIGIKKSSKIYSLTKNTSIPDVKVYV